MLHVPLTICTKLIYSPYSVPSNVLSVNSPRIDIFKSYIVHITVRGKDNIVHLEQLDELLMSNIL